ncbi:MAG: aldehyde dehydrogenase family protein [Deltaproteobacteria bacterium]|jgi:acyl-CoA reductase-like NAD-dependent aldehyde dehydrogenase|nr:aldehyde dehydrogenase family protein [Deltaproteobacteria bacterium]
MHELLRNHIDGEWSEATSRKTVDNVNPADTRQTLGQVVKGGKEEATRAIEAAARAFPGWRRTPAPKRGQILEQAARLMTERKETIARALTAEEGKTLAESRGEVQKAINFLEFAAGEGRRLNGSTVPSELPRTFTYTVRAPLGVVGIVTPWNFPVCIPTWKIAPALVAGNTVIFKPATITPWTASLVTQCFVDAGLPKGVLNLVYGGGSEIGQAIVEHPEVRAISFTGSNEVGSKLYTDASRTLKKVQCEMGGKNPLIVLEDADLELAATATVQGAFGSTGQRCTATSRAIVVASAADRFVEQVVELTKKIRVGNGAHEGVDMGPSVDEGQFQTVLRYHEIGKSEGARCLVGGNRLSDGDLRYGHFSAPTVFDQVGPNSRLAQEEIFGPVLSVIRVKDWAEAIQVANGVAYGLTSSVFTRDVTRVMEYVDEIETGMLHVNSPTVGGEAQLPFGGMKATGVGQREMGQTAVDFYSEWKTVYVDYTGTKRDTKIY